MELGTSRQRTLSVAGVARAVSRGTRSLLLTGISASTDRGRSGRPSRSRRRVNAQAAHGRRTAARERRYALDVFHCSPLRVERVTASDQGATQ